MPKCRIPLLALLSVSFLAPRMVAAEMAGVMMEGGKTMHDGNLETTDKDMGGMKGM